MPFDWIYCGAPVLHMRGLCIDIRAMQQEHSFPIFSVLSLLTSFAIPMGAFVSGYRHSASLATDYPPIHQHPPGRRGLRRSRRSGEAAKLIPSRADISFTDALRRLQPICSSHLLYGVCVTFLNSKGINFEWSYRITV